MGKSLTSPLLSWCLEGLTCFQQLLQSQPVTVAATSYALFRILYHFTAQSLPQLSARTMSFVISQQEKLVSYQKLVCFLFFFKLRIMQFIMHSFFVLAARKLRAKSCTQSPPPNCFWLPILCSLFFLLIHLLKNQHFMFLVDRGIKNIWNVM